MPTQRFEGKRVEERVGEGERERKRVFPSLEEFSTVYCDPHKGFGIVNKAEKMFFWNSRPLSLIQGMLTNRSLVPLPFQKPA